MITVPAQCHDDDWIDIQTASMILGVTPGYARFLARGGRLVVELGRDRLQHVLQRPEESLELLLLLLQHPDLGHQLEVLLIGCSLRHARNQQREDQYG